MYLYLSNFIIAIDACEQNKERNTKLHPIFLIWCNNYLNPILNVVPGSAETIFCCWWARVKVAVAELLKRLVMSVRGTLFGFGLLWFLFLTLLVLHAGGTFSLLLWSIVIVAMSLASICNKFVRWWILGHYVYHMLTIAEKPMNFLGGGVGVCHRLGLG